MDTPRLDYAFQIRIEIEQRLRYGPTPSGTERGFVGFGGEVSGPRLNGTILPHSGGDWMTFLPDGCVSFDARYLIKADNGDIIEITNRGYRHGSPEVMQKMARFENVDPSEFYMRLAPSFDAPDGPHKWLTRTIFVGSAVRGQKHSTFHYWAVL